MISESMIKTLSADLTLVSVHEGNIVGETQLEPLYDKGMHIDHLPTLTVEPGDDVLVTRHKDGTAFSHFMSLTPNLFHYRSPLDEANIVTTEGAIYHV